jgi:crotonobetainyl-CoA:carnitine CoA-transferase CaiB-like acyl-CoA transferase
VSLLLRRRDTGEGGVVDVSLFETAATWMTMYAAQYLASGELPGKNGSGQTGIVPYRAYRTADGDLVVAAGNNDLFRRLCGVLGHPEWTGDPRFATNPARVANARVLYALLEECFLARSNAQWTELLDAAGVPCAPVQDVGGMLRHPQTEALGLVQPVPGSSIPLVGLPVRFDGVRPQPRGASPKLGEMNTAER